MLSDDDQLAAKTILIVHTGTSIGDYSVKLTDLDGDQYENLMNVEVTSIHYDPPNSDDNVLYIHLEDPDNSIGYDKVLDDENDNDDSSGKYITFKEFMRLFVHNDAGCQLNLFIKPSDDSEYYSYNEHNFEKAKKYGNTIVDSSFIRQLMEELGEFYVADASLTTVASTTLTDENGERQISIIPVLQVWISTDKDDVPDDD